MGKGKADVVVRGGTVVSAGGTFPASVAIRDERIVAVGEEEALPPAERTIDATGKYVLPGAIDCHLHLGGLDDWTVGPQAAAKAGITTIIPFANYDHAAEETLPEAVERMKEHVGSRSVVDFSFHFILNNTPYVLDSLPAAMKSGVTSYKMFMTYKKTPLRMCPDSLITQVMEIVAANDGVLQLHCESGDVLDYLQEKAMAEGRTRPADYPATCPDWTEEEAINRAIAMGAMTGCATYVVHLSTRLGLERIKEAQRLGQRVWTETCPQYLLLDETQLERLGPFAKISPPMRSADGVNQEALWQGVAGGHISAIGSDHAPAARELKEPGWSNIFVAPDGRPIPSGAPSVETLVPLVYGEGVVRRGLPLWWMARVLSENPARIFGLYPRKGAIQPGADADLLIIDPEAETTIRAADHLSNSGYTPYEGRTLKGAAWTTLLRGRVLMDRGRLVQEPGYGRFLPAGGPLPPIAGGAG